jgi:NADH-quinone oxidoreductase subunit A
MLPEWGQAGFMIALALIFPIGGIGSSWLLGRVGVRPENPDKVKEATYECGVETEGPSDPQFNFRYFYYALLFVIFDVEAVFLFPWARVFESLGWAAVVEMGIFIGILATGLLYAWRKGVVRWA